MHISNNQKKSTISQLNLEKIIPKQLSKLYQSTHTEYETDETYNENFENVDSASFINYSNISKDQFIAQGFSSNNEYIFVGAYDKNKKESSRIYLYDKITGEYLFYIETDNKSHMGGTSFDKTNNILYITNGSKDIIAINWEIINDYIEHNKDSIERYGFFTYDNINSWCNNANKNALFLIDTANIQMGDGLSSSYSYCDNNYLYIGHFNTASDSIEECKVRQYELNYERDNNKLTIKNITEYPTPIHTQGMATYSKDGNNYIIFSDSLFGSSTLDVYKIEDNGKLKQINTIDLTKYRPAGGVEGIDIYEDGTLHCIFEFEPYNSLSIPVDSLLEYNPIVDRPSFKNRAFKLIAGAWYSSNDLINATSESTSSNLIAKQKILEFKNKMGATILNINDSLDRASSNKKHNIIDRTLSNTSGFISNLVSFPTTYSIFKQTIAKDAKNGKSTFDILSDFSDCIGEPTGNVIIDGIGTGAKWVEGKLENLGEGWYDLWH